MADADSKTIEFVVVTGTCYVMISYIDAERLDFSPNELIFSNLNTSKGLGLGAEVLINSIRIGQIEVSNVQAFGVRGLEESILELSFLSKLQSYESRDF